MRSAPALPCCWCLTGLLTGLTLAFAMSSRGDGGAARIAALELKLRLASQRERSLADEVDELKVAAKRAAAKTPRPAPPPLIEAPPTTPQPPANVTFRRVPGSHTCTESYVHTMATPRANSAEQCVEHCRADELCHAAQFSTAHKGCVLYNPTCRPERSGSTNELYISAQRKPPALTVGDLLSAVPRGAPDGSEEARVLAVMRQVQSGGTVKDVELTAAQRRVGVPEKCIDAIRKQPPQPTGSAPMSYAWRWGTADAAPLSYANYSVVVTSDDLYAMGVHAYVSPKHKLVLFGLAKVACSEWLRMFDRLWGHKDFDAYAPSVSAAPHFRFVEPDRGRLLMRDLSAKQATQIMNDPTWFKALFLRDPAERLLSAYLDKFVENHSYSAKVFREQSRMKFADFVEKVSQERAVPPAGVGPATNVHWRSQIVSHHLYKFLHKLQFVGWSSGKHARLLLKQRGLWKQYGAQGWSRAGRSSPSFMGSRMGEDGHQTGAGRRQEHFMTPELEKKIRKAYALDYAALEAIGLRPGGPPVAGASWRPRAARCPGPNHPAGIPRACPPGLPVPRACLDGFRLLPEQPAEDSRLA